MKRILGIILALSFIISSMPCSMAEDNVYRDIYVDVNGNDDSAGSKENPFATIERAQKEVRSISENMSGDIVVHLGSGTFRLDEKLLFTTEDSGKNGYSVIWQGADNNSTVISGGEQVTGFKKSEEYEGVWETTVPQFDSILQLTVNGESRYVAKSANLVKALPRNEKIYNDEYYKQHPEDKTKEHIYYYVDPETPFLADGLFMSKKDIGFYENAEDMFFKTDIYWTTNIKPVQSIEQDPNDSDRVIVRMKNPFFSYDINLNDTLIIRFNPQRGFTMMNAMEFLDEPGEFYFNRKTKKLYYIPQENEDMTTAEVVVPKLEELAEVKGSDIDKKVTNLIFKGISFRDTKLDYSGGYKGNQARDNDGPRVYGRGFRGVEVSYADNVSFYDNVFSCMAEVALELSNACENCTVKGNTFYDIGDSGIVVGEPYHSDYNIGADGVSDEIPESAKDAPVELVQRINTHVNASAYTGSDNSYRLKYVTYKGLGSPDSNMDKGEYDFLNKTWFDQESLTENHNKKPYEGAWLDDSSYLRNEKPWVKIELDQAYTLDEIVVSFDPNVLDKAQTSDFEILASNDISFKEYDVIKTVNGAPESDINRYKVQSEAKYRYIMIRSLDVKAFGVSHVWATTKDIKPYIKNQKCKNINIEDNYFERIAMVMNRGIAVIVLNVDDTKVLHNEIINTGYCGISIGYHWTTRYVGCRNIEGAYNLTYNTNQTMHDGGGIYTLGPQPGSVYHNNYIRAVRLGSKNFYTDNGTSLATITGNVMIGGTTLLAPYNNDIINNVFRNNYGNHSISSDTYAKLNDYEPQKVILPGQSVDSISYDTMEHAGLEPEYKSNKEKVPAAKGNLETKYELLYTANNFDRFAEVAPEAKGINEELNNLISEAKYGSGLGMYPYECKNMIENMREYFDGAENSDYVMRNVKAHELEDYLVENFRRYSFEDTMKLCEEKLAFAKENTVPESGQKSCNKYPKEAVDEFEKALSAVKTQSANISSENEYTYLVELENAYNTLESKRNSAEIEYVYADNVSNVEINKEERNIKLHLPQNASSKLTGVEICVSKNAKLAKIVGTDVDLEKPLTLPVYCNGNNRYKMWTMSIVRDEANDISNLGKANWISTVDDANGMIKKFFDNSTCLPASEYIYMADGFAKNGATELTFNPLTRNEDNSFTVILGAENADKQEHSTLVNNRCEIVFDNSKADFYKIVNGQKTLVTSVSNSKIKYNQKNKLSYTITEIDDNLYFKVWLNGELIFTPVINRYSWSSYAGIYSRYMDIKIYE